MGKGPYGGFWSTEDYARVKAEYAAEMKRLEDPIYRAELNRRAVEVHEAITRGGKQ
jgi:hypothetical protein